MLAALALIWFLLFVPSWTKRSEQKGDVARERQAQRDKLSRSVSAGVAIKAARVSRTKIVSLTFAIVGAGVSTVSLIQGGVLVSSIAAAVFVLAGLIGKSPVARKREESTTVDEKVWTPDEVPNQVFGRVGTLEEIVLAEVVELPKQEELDSKTLDEILRRRRAN